MDINLNEKVDDMVNYIHNMYTDNGTDNSMQNQLNIENHHR